jgi:uncharacterized protein with GYD domain
MPIYVTQGRYTSEAIQGMVQNPEDRSAALSKLAEKAGGKMLSYYVTFGEYDFVVIYEAPDSRAAAAIVLTAAAGGSVAHLRTVEAMTAAQAKEAFAAAGTLRGSFKSAGKG